MFALKKNIRGPIVATLAVGFFIRRKIHGQSRCGDFEVGQANYGAETVCGDSFVSFSFGENKLALILSDGMGKGAHAAKESSLVARMAQSLLMQGFDVNLVIKTINRILVHKGSDMFATLDITIIDRTSLVARIYKMGAAATFIKRGNTVCAVKRSALPMGIEGEIAAVYTEMQLKKGDVLLMVSDGILDCDRKDTKYKWIKKALAKTKAADSKLLCEHILGIAIQKYGANEKDDMSVMSVRV